MLNTMFSKDSLPALEQTVYFTAARHRVLMNNIANIETPGYKTLDVSEKDFKRAMKDAYKAQHASPVGTFEFLGRDGVLPKPGGGLATKPAEVHPDQAGILRHIENNVDVDLEMGKMVKNAQLHNLAVALLNHQFSMIREAIGERVTG